MTEVVEEQVVKEKKGDKTSKVLFIIGCVFLVLAIVTTCIFSYYTISFFTAPEGEELGSALGFILVFAYFFIPSLFFGIVAIISNVLAYKKAEKWKVAKLVCMILSIVVTSLDVLLYVIIRMM